MKEFKYTDEDINILSTALKNAFNSVDCDNRCFDWLSYNPDKYIKKRMYAR